jgi:hypothetical protein
MSESQMCNRKTSAKKCSKLDAEVKRKFHNGSNLNGW